MDPSLQKLCDKMVMSIHEIDRDTDSIAWKLYKLRRDHPNYKEIINMISSKYYQNETMLMAAVRNKNIRLVYELLQSGANATFVNSDGNDAAACLNFDGEPSWKKTK
jgi:hypothetical protein